MDTHKKIREHISTLVDGALSDSDLELALAALQSADGQQAWNTYHRIGDALRAAATPELSDAFADKLAARLANEPVPLRKATRAAPGPDLHATLGPGRQPQTRVLSASASGSGSGSAGEGAPEALAVSQAKPAVISVS